VQGILSVKLAGKISNNRLFHQRSLLNTMVLRLGKQTAYFIYKRTGTQRLSALLAE
jgi:hypothetical protein